MTENSIVQSGGSSSVNLEEDGRLAAVAEAHLNIGTISPTEHDTTDNLSSEASSILQVLLPSLTKLDDMLESVWTKQDTLNEVLNRLATELDQFDELVKAPSPESSFQQQQQSDGNASTSMVSRSQMAAQRIKESKSRIANINATLKRVKARLDNINVLAQAKIAQQQQQQSQ